MREIAVVDIRDGFSAAAVHTEGLQGGAVKGTALIKGSFLREAAAAQVKEALDRISPDPDYLILLLPRSLFHLTSAHIPARDAEMLARMMEFEVPRHFPIPPERLVHAYTVAERSDAGYTVNIAGLKLEDFDAYYNAARAAGLHADIVSLFSAALPPAAGDAPRVSVDISRNGFDLTLARGKKTVYSRWFRFKPELDERDFLSGGILADTPAPQAADQIAAELDRLKLASGVDNLPEYLENLIITGGVARLRQAVANRLALRAELRGAKVKTLPAEKENDGVEYAAAAFAAAGFYQEGAAFNFIPKTMRRLRHHVARRLLRGAAVAIAALMMVWAGAAYGVRWKAMHGLEAELAGLKREARKGEGLQLKMGEYQTYFDGLNAFTAQRSFNMEMLAALTGGLPRDAFITELEFRPCAVTLAGVSANATTLLKAMEGAGGLKNAQMLAAVQTTPAGERFRMGMECK